MSKYIVRRKKEGKWEADATSLENWIWSGNIVANDEVFDFDSGMWSHAQNTIAWDKVHHMTTEDDKIHDTLEISLNSGEIIHVRKVRLYDSGALSQISTLKEQAKAKLEGYSSGLGFWGSPGWVIAGSLILGALESNVSNSMAREGSVLLRNAIDAFNRTRTGGTFFEVSRILNISYPSPEMWFSYVEEIGETKKSLKSLPKLPDDEKWMTRKTYVHNGDPFVTVIDASGSKINIVSDKIEKTRTLSSPEIHTS